MEITKEDKRKANAYARSIGYGSATTIVFGDKYKCLKRVAPGYRKCTTDEYVPNAYRQNFGWKNTYYQHAETVIQIPKEDQ